MGSSGTSSGKQNRGGGGRKRACLTLLISSLVMGEGASNSKLVIIFFASATLVACALQTRPACTGESERCVPFRKPIRIYPATEQHGAACGTPLTLRGAGLALCTRLTTLVGLEAMGPAKGGHGTTR